MPIEVGLWKLGDRPVPVSFERLESESRLENLPFLDAARWRSCRTGGRSHRSLRSFFNSIR